MTDKILDSHHVTRHCTPSRLDGELPKENAFEVDLEDGCISVHWLEKVHPGDCDIALDGVRKVLREQRTVKPSHRLVVVNVGDVRSVLAELGVCPCVSYRPTRDDRLHAGICPHVWEPEDLLRQISRDIAALVTSDECVKEAYLKD